MAGAGGFKVQGLTKLTRNLQALGLEVDDLKDAFSAIAEKGSRLAAQYAPRRSGQLAGDVRGNRAKSKAVVTVGRARVPYAGPINYGWPARGIRPSLFLQRADEAMRPQVLDLLEDAINDKIRDKGLQ